MSFDFRERRFDLNRLRPSQLLNGGGGRILTFLAGGGAVFLYLEFGALAALAVTGGLISLGALAMLVRKANSHPHNDRRQAPAEASSSTLNWLEPARVPFGPNQRMLNSTLVAANNMPDTGPAVVRPRYFMDPLMAGSAEANLMAARSGPEAFVGFTLRRRFEDALKHALYEDAARIIAEMAETTDNQAWCVNASRRLAHRRSRLMEQRASIH